MTTTTGGRALPNAAFTSKGTSTKRLPGPLLPSLVLNRLTMRSLETVVFAGQIKMEGCAPLGVGGGPQPAPVQSDDRSADRKPHAGALRLGGEECIEDPGRLLRGQSHAGIADRDHQVTTLGSLRFDDQFTYRAQLLDGVDAIEHEVHEHLLQLHAVCLDLGKPRGKVGENGDGVAGRLAAQQDDYFFNDFVHIKRHALSDDILDKLA